MEIQEKIPLADFSTLKVGGSARYFAMVKSVEEVEEARQFAQQTDVPLLMIGSGSNILFRDQGFPGLVLKNEILGRDYLVTDDGKVTAKIGAGEILDEVIADTVERGYWGLENLSHIPGTVGATPVQNVGAYGVEVSSLIASVNAYNLNTGEQKVFSNKDCHFSYRESFFKTLEGRDWLIASVTFELMNKPNAVLDYKDPILGYKDMSSLGDMSNVTQSQVRNTIVDIRSRKFPDWNIVGTAGSFFKNPIIENQKAKVLASKFPHLPMFSVGENFTKVSIGYVLDQVCGLRGFSKGDVGLYEGHALVLVSGAATAGEIESFVKFVTDTVYEKTGLIIEQEVRTV